MSSLKDRKRSLVRDRGLAFAVAACVLLWTVAVGWVWPAAVVLIAAGTLLVLAISYAADQSLRRLPRP